LILFETENVLSRPPVAGLFYQLYEDAVSVVKQYDYSGKMLREIGAQIGICKLGLVVK
jgi:prolyl oligopeptidase